MTQIDIHTKFIIFVSVAPQQEQGKVDIESKTYSKKVHGRVLPELPSLAPSRNSMKEHGWVLPENIFFSKALCLDSVKTSSTHKIESDQSDDDMEYSLFDDVKGK